MMIIQQITGGPWVCINEFTGARIEFVDVTAISRLGTAMNSGVQGLFTQLETGTIFSSCDNPQSVQAVWNDFFVEDDAISIFGYGAAGETGMEADELVEGATTLAGTVVEDAGIGEWVLLILGLVAVRGQKTKSADVDITRATPAWKLEPADVARAIANRKISNKALELQKQRTTSTATHSIQWFNSIPSGDTPITINTWGVNGGVFQHLTVSPDPAGSVMPFNSIQALGWYDGAVGFEPSSNGWIVLSLPQANVGVNVHEPGRVADVGTPPYYQIWYSGIEGNTWTTPVSDPSQKYIFPMDKVGYKITITPQATAETLFVTVNMQVS